MAKKRKRAGGKAGISRREFLIGTGAVAAVGLTGCAPAFGGDDGSGRKDTAIVSARIHPGIGVARVGNSATDFYIGPEVTTPALTTSGQMRDITGALKRQAARFRVYGYNAAGEVVQELTAADADIAWNVQLANKKGAWYRFIAALDVPEASTTLSPRRNATVAGAARQDLIFDPGARSVTGVSSAPVNVDGTHMGVALSLGELRTDEAGRLLVLGGLGKSGSPGNTPIFNPQDADSFNNADGWYDDTSDGPVSATVNIGGRSIPVDPAWVIVAPPNYAPDVIGWRTLHDLLVDTYLDAGLLAFPATTSFTRDILPVLQRLTNLQWVNQGFAKTFGRGGQWDFDDANLVARLAAPTGDVELRRQVYAQFRDPDIAMVDPNRWPWIYGDAFGSFDGSPRSHLALSRWRDKHLQRWAAGAFVADWNPAELLPQTVEGVALADQPATLDQAALHFCLADAFHPGCEVTWPMRHASLYRAPFRIRIRDAGSAEPDYGETLTQANAIGPGGPLNAQGAGDLTRWMALPWQGDTAFCRSGYEPDFDPYIPTFWPARVPNHVLTADDYAIAVDATQPHETRVAAFQRRQPWVRVLKGSAPAQMTQMVRGFDKLGVVEARPGVDGDPALPPVMLVESLPPDVRSVHIDAPVGVPRTAVEEAGWESREQLEEFRRIKRGKRSKR